MLRYRDPEWTYNDWVHTLVVQLARLVISINVKTASVVVVVVVVSVVTCTVILGITVVCILLFVVTPVLIVTKLGILLLPRHQAHLKPKTLRRQ